MPRRWDWDQYLNIGAIGAREAREVREEPKVELPAQEEPVVPELLERKVGPAIHHPNVVMRAPVGAYVGGQRVTVEVGRRSYGRLVEQYELEVISVEGDEKDPTVQLVTFKRAGDQAESAAAPEPHAEQIG